MWIERHWGRYLLRRCFDRIEELRGLKEPRRAERGGTACSLGIIDLVGDVAGLKCDGGKVKEVLVGVIICVDDLLSCADLGHLRP